MILCDILKISIQDAITKLFSQKVDFELEHPALEKHGYYSTSIALQLSKKLHRSPFEIAEMIVKEIPKSDFISNIEIIKPGFINFFININWLTKISIKNIIESNDNYGIQNIGKGQKVIIEHTSVNPNKAMHVGNLRNAILGDSIVRLFRKCGYQIEVQNYIDDTGSQVADTTTAILFLKKRQPKNQPFDEFCWNIYSEINHLYEIDPKLVEKKKEVTKKIEESNNEIATLAKEVSNKVLQCHLTQLAKFGILYDLLIYESDVLKFGFWDQAFERLKKSPNFVYKTSGDQKGCWVLQYEGEGGGDKIFIRNNGTKVYTAKDTAYHMWKFGLLGKDFLYEKWPYKIGVKEIWRTSTQGKQKDGFGQANKIINVIDERQIYPQEMVRLALKTLGFEKQAKNYHHLAYGVVYLSPLTAKKLGVDVSDKKTFYAMAGRKGIGIKIADLLDLLVSKIENERKDKQFKTEKGMATSLDVAIGAIRHYMLKYNSNSSVVFDYEQALALRGNTGVYLQYSHARASGILKKGGKFIPLISKEEDLNNGELSMVKLLSYWPEIITRSVNNLSIAEIADYAFKLSAMFHSFYETNPVLKSKTKIKNFRLTLVLAYKIVIAEVLSILGIFSPERM